MKGNKIKSEKSSDSLQTNSPTSVNKMSGRVQVRQKSCVDESIKCMWCSAAALIILYVHATTLTCACLCHTAQLGVKRSSLTSKQSEREEHPYYTGFLVLLKCVYGLLCLKGCFTFTVS